MGIRQTKDPFDVSTSEAVVKRVFRGDQIRVIRLFVPFVISEHIMPHAMLDSTTKYIEGIRPSLFEVVKSYS